MIRNRKTGNWLMAAGLFLALLVSPMFFGVPQHPLGTLKDHTKWSASMYFGAFFAATILVWRGLVLKNRQHFNVPIIYACKVNERIGACNPTDYELAMRSAGRARNLFGINKYRPQPDLMAIFTDDPTSASRLGQLKTGSLLDWEMLSENCEVRWVELQVPESNRQTQRAIPLDAATKLLRGDFARYSYFLDMAHSGERSAMFAVLLAGALFVFALAYNIWTHLA